MTKPAARKGDQHNCSKDGHSGGVIVEGSDNILIEGTPAARVGDAATCENGGENKIVKGSATVFFNDQPAARVDDQLEHGGVIVSGAADVIIGSGGGRVVFGNKGKILIGGKGKVIIGGKPAASNHATDVSCPIAIGEIQKEADAIANIENHVERNKKITAEYVKLFQENPHLEWVHTAIYASKQVGCAIRHLTVTTEQIPFYDLTRINQKFVMKYVADNLGEGNKAVFKDVYPLLKFYNKYSFKKIQECYPLARKNNPIIASLKQLETGNVDNAAFIILEHEQNKILQPMYKKILIYLMAKVNHHGAVFAANLQSSSDYLGNKALAHSEPGFLNTLLSLTYTWDSFLSGQISKKIYAIVQPEKVNLSSECWGGPEHDMSDIDITKASLRVKSAKVLIQLVKSNNMQNYLDEVKHLNKLLKI